MKVERILVATALLASAGPGISDECQPAPDESGADCMAIDESAQLEETIELETVTVSARRRLEPLLQAPVAVTAFSGQDLEIRKLDNVSEVAAFTPNMVFDFTSPLSGSTNSASVFIRGVGQTDYVPNKDPGVGIYLDGVYIARTVGSVLNLLDVENVEVLRGPQGTLFGKNTIGGAINVTTARPTGESRSKVDVTLGSDDRRDLRGFIEAPLSPSWAGRWSFGAFRQDGYMNRVLVGDRQGENDEIAARMSLRWSPRADFVADFMFDYSRADESSTASKLLSTDIRVPTSPFSIGDPGTVLAGQIYNVLIGAEGECVETIFGCLPPLPATAVPYDRRWLTDSPFETNATGPNYSEHSLWGANATLKWSGPARDIKSITAYRSTDSNFGRDPDGSPLLIGQSEIWVDYEQFSQELQVLGTSVHERLDWIAGVYYLSETGRQRDRVPFGGETFSIYESLGIPLTNFLLINGEDSVNSIDSLAFYGEASWSLTDRLELTAGLRWTTEERETVANITQGGIQSVVNPRARLDFDDTSGRLILAYRPDSRWLLYTSYSEGFKSGGFNHRFAVPPPPLPRLQSPTRFDPESVESYEVGFKSSLWGGRARLTGAVFSARYQDIQALVLDLGVPRTVNAAAGEIDGVEFEFSAAATRNLQLDLAYGYLDARYTRLQQDVPGAFGNPISILPITLDSEFVNTPEHSLAVGMQSNLLLQGGSELLLRADASYRSEVANDAFNTPEAIQESLWLFSASVNWVPTRCRCEISLFGRNLSNETYFVSGGGDSVGAGIAERIMARPREWGVRLSYWFD